MAASLRSREEEGEDRVVSEGGNGKERGSFLLKFSPINFFARFFHRIFLLEFSIEFVYLEKWVKQLVEGRASKRGKNI